MGQLHGQILRGEVGFGIAKGWRKALFSDCIFLASLVSYCISPADATFCPAIFRQAQRCL
jgi:hypothetical protein